MREIEERQYIQKQPGEFECTITYGNQNEKKNPLDDLD